jgi:hypothetical protein
MCNTSPLITKTKHDSNEPTNPRHQQQRSSPGEKPHISNSYCMIITTFAEASDGITRCKNMKRLKPNIFFWSKTISRSFFSLDMLFEAPC